MRNALIYAFGLHSHQKDMQLRREWEAECTSFQRSVEQIRLIDPASAAKALNAHRTFDQWLLSKMEIPNPPNKKAKKN